MDGIWRYLTQPQAAIATLLRIDCGRQHRPQNRFCIDTASRQQVKSVPRLAERSLSAVFAGLLGRSNIKKRRQYAPPGTPLTDIIKGYEN
jgi:hypothetical protein